MQNRVEDQVLITARNKRVPIFNDGKLSKPYLQKLSVNAKSFLNREKNTNANRRDVTEYLRSRGFVNSAIQTNPEFIGFIQKVVPEHRVGLVLPPGKDALRHLRTVIQFDPKYFKQAIVTGGDLGRPKEQQQYGKDGQTIERCHKGGHRTTQCQIRQTQEREIP